MDPYLPEAQDVLTNTLLSRQTFGSLISPNWKMYTPMDILPSKVFQASANRQTVLRDEQCCPAACRKSHLFVLRSEMWSDSKAFPAIVHGARLQPYLCQDCQLRSQCQMCTFTQLFCECGLHSFTKKFALMLRVLWRQTKVRGEGVVLNWPQQTTRMPFLKWISRLLILCYMLFYISLY